MQTNARTRDILLAALAAGVVAWLWYRWPEATPTELLRDPDAAYQLLRVERCLDDYPHVTAVDRFSHAGRPFLIHWPPGWTLALASIARLENHASADPGALAASLSWLPPVLGAVAACLASLLASALGLNALRAFAAASFGAMTCEGLVAFSIGGLDHHGITAVAMGLLALALATDSIATWALGLLVLFACAPMAFVHAALFMAVATVASVACRSSDRRSRWAWWLLPALAATLACAVQALAEPNREPSIGWTFVRLSALQPVALLLAGAACLAALHANRRHGLAALAFVAASTGCVAVLLSASDAPSFLAWSVGGERVQVDELASPVLPRLGRLDGRGPLLVIAAAALVVRAAGLARRREPRREQLLIAMLAGCALLLSVWQYRHFRDLSPIVWAALGVAFFGIHDAVSARLRGHRVVVACVVTAALAVPVALSFGLRGLGQRIGRGQHGAVMSHIVVPIAEWLRDHAPPPGSRAEGKPSYTVMAPWNIGHHVNVLANRPVLVDPFNHVDTHALMSAFYLATDAAELDAFLSDNGTRYVALVDTDRETHSIAGGEVTGSPFAYALQRDLGLSDAYAHLRPRLYVSTRPARLSCDPPPVPRGQIFERVRGATVRGRVGSLDGVYRVSCLVEVMGEESPRAWTTRVRAVNGEIAFQTALPAPIDETTFRVPSGYEIAGPRGERFRARVSARAVNEGESVEIAPASAAPAARRPSS